MSEIEKLIEELSKEKFYEEEGIDQVDPALKKCYSVEHPDPGGPSPHLRMIAWDPA